MKRMKRIIKANLLAGLSPGLVAPVIWPIVAFLVDGKFPTWSTYPMAALSISFFAIIIGLVSCLVLGSPTLISLEKLNLNTPTSAGTSGFIIALFLYFLFTVSKEQSSITQSWPLGVFFAVLGGICGSTASLLSRTNKSLM